MIVSKLARVTGDRLVNLSEISRATGISRPTLTNIYYRRTKGIDFETLDKLCAYLQCGVEDILEYTRDTEEKA